MLNPFEAIILGHRLADFEAFIREEDNIFKVKAKQLSDRIEPGFNLFQAAAGFDRDDIMDAIAKRNDFTGRHMNHLSSRTGNTPLLHAIKFGNRRAVEWLLKSGASVNNTNYSWKNELNQAFTFPCDETLAIAAMLVKKGCDIRHSDKDGDTPLDNLIKSKSVTHDLIQFFLMNDVDVGHLN